MGPILACADTNAATDNLVEGLIERGIDVVRLGQPAKVRGLFCFYQSLLESYVSSRICSGLVATSYSHSHWN